MIQETTYCPQHGKQPLIAARGTHSVCQACLKTDLKQKAAMHAALRMEEMEPARDEYEQMARQAVSDALGLDDLRQQLRDRTYTTMQCDRHGFSLKVQRDGRDVCLACMREDMDNMQAQVEQTLRRLDDKRTPEGRARWVSESANNLTDWSKTGERTHPGPSTATEGLRAQNMRLRRMQSKAAKMGARSAGPKSPNLSAEAEALQAKLGEIYQDVKKSSEGPTKLNFASPTRGMGSYGGTDSMNFMSAERGLSAAYEAVSGRGEAFTAKEAGDGPREFYCPDHGRGAPAKVALSFGNEGWMCKQCAEARGLQILA